jgi:hypothetical protein
LGDLGHPREILRRVINGQLLVGRENGLDAPHAFRDPKQIDQVLSAANERRTRQMRCRFGERVRKSVVDQIETGVVRQVAIVEDETDEPLPWHG